MRLTQKAALGLALLLSASAGAQNVSVVTGEQVEAERNAQTQQTQAATGAPSTTTAQPAPSGQQPTPVQPVATQQQAGAAAPANQNATNATAPQAAPAGSAQQNATTPQGNAAQPPEQVTPEVQALRQQVAQQQQQLQLLQQQVANQEAQQQSLNEVNQNLHEVQQGQQASQEQVAERDAQNNETLQHLDEGINRIRVADQYLSAGTSDVDLTSLAESMQGQARSYTELAQQWLSIGDYYSARSYLDLALLSAMQARDANTGNVPPQPVVITPP